ncbi:MAG: FtsX-like permease family protein, partial [Bacteroidota bacterium]
FQEVHKLMKKKDDVVSQDFLRADKKLAEYLSLNFVEGNINSFEDPYQAIISEQMAYKLGFREDAINQVIELEDSAGFQPYKVIGVYETTPQNSSIRPDLIIPFSNYLGEAKEEANKFISFDVSVILEFSPEAQPDIVKTKIKELIDEHAESKDYSATIIPIASIHLEEKYLSGNGFLPGGNRELIWYIAIAGFACLIISVINYANFSISLYVGRAREVAVRKIMGSAKNGVFQQLMVESFLTTLIAACLAVLLFVLIAPQFSQLAEKKFDISSLINRRFIPGNILIVILISMLSGLYPSFLLSRFNIINSLKGVQKVGKGKFVMQTLLVVQFSISIAMIACMLTFKGQLNLLMGYDKGYNVDNVVRVSFSTAALSLGESKVDVFMNKLDGNPHIVTKTASGGFGMNSYKDGDLEFGLLNMAVDEYYFDVLQLRIIDGTNLKEAVRDGTIKGVVVNEAFLRQTGLTDPIGKIIPFKQAGQEKSIIVGVVKDYYSSTPKHEVSPVLFYEKAGSERTYNVLVKTSTNRATIEKELKKVWSEVFDLFPLNYEYLSVAYNKRLEQEAKISKVSSTGSVIAIFIAGFGLLGLVGLTIRQRLKEVSIRRVLGASLSNISEMMTRKFIIPISISLAIGLTLSFYLANMWLEDYPIRIDFGWEYMGISTFSILAILFFIIFTQVSRATRENPVVHLKDE